MKILLMSYAYPPSLGGLELFSSILRDALIARGHEVRVATYTPSNESEEGILRRPAKADLERWIDWADLCFISGVSLNFQIPVLLAGKPMVITHHAWQEQYDGTSSFLQRLKLFVCGFGLNITVNRALAADLPMPALAIYNPVHTVVDPGLDFAARPRDLVYLGRLVSEKGVPVLVDAIARLRDRGIEVRATIIGEGPDKTPLEQQAAAAGVRSSIRFTGRLNLPQIQTELGQHRIMVVPSIYKEPFPMAVLEGLAAGCVPIASHTGGLPEGVGRCGMTLPMKDDQALADAIANLIAHPEIAESYRAAIPAHLATMDQDRIVDRYIEAFELYFEYRVQKRLSGSRAARLTVADLTRNGSIDGGRRN